MILIGFAAGFNNFRVRFFSSSLGPFRVTLGLFLISAYLKSFYIESVKNA